VEGVLQGCTHGPAKPHTGLTPVHMMPDQSTSAMWIY
jgi:hypothetical protein